MIPKIDDLQKERAYVADEHKALLQHLKDDLRIFPTQLDAWAFAAAYAMSKHTSGEKPKTPKKKEQLPPLQVLSADLLTGLLEADNYISSTSGWNTGNDSHNAMQRLSDWGSLGLSLLETEWQGRGREQIRHLILDTITLGETRENSRYR